MVAGFSRTRAEGDGLENTQRLVRDALFNLLDSRAYKLLWPVSQENPAVFSWKSETKCAVISWHQSAFSQIDFLASILSFYTIFYGSFRFLRETAIPSRALRASKVILVAPAIVRKKNLVVKIKRELVSKLSLIKKMFLRLGLRIYLDWWHPKITQRQMRNRKIYLKR